MDDWLHRADSLLDLGRHAEAVQVLTAGLHEHPDDDLTRHALTLLAMAHLGLGQHAAALESADRLVATTPDAELGHRLRSAALGGLRRRHDALVAAEESRRLEPGAWQSHAAFAQAAAEFPVRSQEALAAARHAVALAPGEPDTHFVLGVVAGAVRRFEESEAAYRRVLALDPTHAGARNNLTSAGGFSLGLRRRVDGYAEALQQQPDLAVAQTNLAILVLSFLRRTHLAVLAVLLVCAGIAQADGSELTRASTGALGLVGLLAWTVLWWRTLPTGVRVYWARHVTSSPALLLLVVVVAVDLVVACWAAFLAVPDWFPRGVLRPLGLVNVLGLVLSRLRVR